MQLYTKIAIITLLIGALAITPTLSTPTSTVIIANQGKISAIFEVNAKSGSPEDIQAAVDVAATMGGGNVYVPEGDFVFNPEDAPSGKGVQIPGGVNVFGAGKDKTILRQTRQPKTTMFMFTVDGRNGLPSRISNFTFIGFVVTEEYSGGVSMYNVKNFRVDNCRFINMGWFGVSTSVYTSAASMEKGEYQYYWNWGVIDHCTFDNPYKDEITGSWAWGYGVGVFGGAGGTDKNAWLYNVSDILGRWDIETNPIRCALYQWNATTGKYDLVDPYGGKYFRWLVYIEDCTFSRCRHAIASNGGAWYVARHNTFKDNRPVGWPNVDVHGAMGGQGWWGGRGAEVYNNIINETAYTTGGWGIDYRGGGGVVFNNTIINCQYGVSMRYEGSGTNEVCWVNDLWIWNNNFLNVATQIYDPYNLYDEGVHYFLRQRPYYTPYTYPHPSTQKTTP